MRREGRPIYTLRKLRPRDFDARYFSSGGYDEYQEDVASWIGSAARYIHRLLRNAWDPTVLDVGCAHGFLLAVLQNQYGIRVRGLEYSDYARRTAEPSVKRRIKRGNVLSHGSFPRNSFDVVVCLDVFGHLRIEETQQAADNLVHWTRRFILFSTLYRHSPQASQEVNPDPFRITTLSQKEYKTIFRKAGARFVKKINFGNGGEVLVFKKRKK